MTAGLISAFNPIQEYSNVNVPTVNTDDANKFGDVLKNSTENQANLKNDVSDKDMSKKDIKSEDKVESKVEETKSNSAEEDKAEKTEETKAEDKTVEEDAAKIEEMPEENIQAITQMLEQIMQAIAQILETPVENVEEAIANLGLELGDVADVTNIPDIVVELTDAESTMDIMTDEKLYETVKEITDVVKETTVEVAKELEVEPQELPEIAQKVVQDVVKPQEVEKPQIEVVVSETKPETTEENTLQQQVLTVDTKGQKSEADSEEEGKQNPENQINFTTNVAETAKEAPVAEVESPVASYTTAKDIINQVTDSIKTEIKADMNELEINLHPASLGNVKVQIINRDGVISANFTAQNDVVKEALESQLIDLKESMNEHGIKVEAIEVTVESHAFDENLSQQSDREAKEAEEIEAKKKKTRSINRDDLIEDIEEETDDDIRLAREMMMANGGTVDYLT